MMAVIGGQTDNLRLLIKAGANVNAHDQAGMTPLIHAAQDSNTDVICLLLKAGAETNARTSEGYTALSYALTNGDEDTIKLLRSKGGTGEPLPAPPEDAEADN